MYSPDPSSLRRGASARRGTIRGLSLIELLIGISIGLLVILVAIGTLMVSRGSSAAVSDATQLQQQASYALRVIGQQMRQAGAIEPTLDTATQLFTFASTYAGYGTTTAAVNGVDGNTGPDTLSTSTTRTPQLAGSQMRNCLGQVVDSGNIEATFRLVGGTLRCATTPSDTSGQALIQNVADFQVNYRVLTGASMRILNAADVNSAGLWSSVKAVEVCLHMQGTERLPDAGTSYTDCKGNTKPRNGRLHLVYRNVFDLRVARSTA